LAARWLLEDDPLFAGAARRLQPLDDTPGITPKPGPGTGNSTGGIPVSPPKPGPGPGNSTGGTGNSTGGIPVSPPKPDPGTGNSTGGTGNSTGGTGNSTGGIPDSPTNISSLCIDLTLIEGINEVALSALTGLLSGADAAEVVDGKTLCLDSTLVEDLALYEGLSCFDILSLIDSPIVSDALLDSYLGDEYKGNGTFCLNSTSFVEKLLEPTGETGGGNVTSICIDLNSIEGIDVDTLTGLIGSVDIPIELVNDTTLCLDSTLVDSSKLGELNCSVIEDALGDSLAGNGTICTVTPVNDTICIDLNSIEDVVIDASVLGILDVYLQAISSAELVNDTILCLDSSLVFYQDGSPCVDVISLIDSPILTDGNLETIFGDGYQGNGIFCLPNNLRDFTDSELIQRYLLVLFYYQTTDNRKQPWNSDCVAPGDFLDGSDECDYVLPSRFKDGRIDPDSPPSAKPASRWLSADTECSWAGVVCSDDTAEVEQIWLGR
jgi:hypothetical protein